MSRNVPAHLIRRVLNLTLILLMTFATAISAEEGAWKLYSAPSPRTDASMVEMTADGSILLFGGVGRGSFFNDTWLYKDGSWKRMIVPGPTARSRAAICYDPDREVVIIYGGLYKDTVLGDVWEWNGKAWKQKGKKIKNGPLPREGAAMAYDAAAGRVVMFGGRNNGSFYSDTWQWTGKTWKTVLAATPPTPRYKHAMAWCEAAGAVIMFGGLNVTADVGDTWKLTGATWTRLTASGPSAREAAAMTSLADGTLLLFGGAKGNRMAADTWNFSGSAWKKIKVRGLSGRAGAAMARDPQTDAIVLFGGWRSGAVNDELWIYTTGANRWTKRNFEAPTPRRFHAMAWDPLRQRLVIFGGEDASGLWLDDTWEWNAATGWHRMAAAGPEARAGAAMAWDPTRGKIVMTGGRYHGSPNPPYQYTDTWEWDGTTWLEIDGDGPESSGALAYSPALNTLVLLQAGDGYYPTEGVTWKLVDNEWEEFALTTVPGERTRSRMALNPLTDQIVLFSGYGWHWSRSWPYCYSDVWTFDGSAWQEVLGDNPSGRQDYALGFLNNSAHLYLHGGYGVGPDPNKDTGYYNYQWRPLAETWRWTGSEWQFMSHLGPARHGHSICWVDNPSRLIMFGGEESINGETTLFNDLWVLDPLYGSKGTHDIAYVQLKASDEPMLPGTTVKLTATIRNAGPGASPDLPQRFYISLDDQLDPGDVLIASGTIPAMKVDAIGTEFVTKIDVDAIIGKIPQEIRDKAYNKRFYLIAALDDGEQSKDRNWRNNMITTGWYVTIEY